MEQIPLPDIDKRLQDRYLHLVKEQSHSARLLSAGIAALPGAGQAFASTQAAWRFFNNSNVTPPLLIEPLREAVRKSLAKDRYVLAALDWSKIDYHGHKAKKDRREFCNPGEAGYSLTSVLAIDASDGRPLGPLEFELESALGTHTTRCHQLQTPVHYVEQVSLIMTASVGWQFPARPVFIMDREYDSLDHYRQWNAGGHLFLVRADTKRRVKFNEESILLEDLVTKLAVEGKFQQTRHVEYGREKLPQFVAEAEVVLDRPSWKRKADGTNYRVAGPPLTLRLVVSEIRDAAGKVVSRWLLFTNLLDVPASEIALWYYWRWQIESFFKLLKTGGVCLEEWQQETAGAILKRLLVACMACVTVWKLERLKTPEAEACKSFLVRLSGRQMKRSRPVTTSALLAGLRQLLVIEDVIEQYGLDEIRRIGKIILADLKQDRDV